MQALRRLSQIFIRKLEGVKVTLEAASFLKKTLNQPTPNLQFPKGSIPEGTVLGDSKIKYEHKLVLTHVSSQSGCNWYLPNDSL